MIGWIFVSLALLRIIDKKVALLRIIDKKVVQQLPR